MVLTSRRMANKYRNILVICLGTFLVWQVVGFAYAFENGFVSSLLAVLLLPVPMVAIPWAYCWPRYKTWSIGAKGEAKVAGALSSLKGCNVYHDVLLPGERKNIDHIVLARNGVFVIETKNNKGTIKCNGDSWELEKVGRKGTPYAGHIGNPSKQVKRNALALRNFILDRVGIRLYVNGIVCFTNRECVLEVNEPTVPVVRLAELENFILIYMDPKVISVEELARIKPELEKLAVPNG